MTKMLLAALVAGAVSFAGIFPAAAQPRPTALVKVPFDFLVGDKLMPAGVYRISPETMAWAVLIISSVDGKTVGRFKSTETPNPASWRSREVELRFNNYHGHYFLQQVAFPGRNVTAWNLTKAQAERTLTKLNLMPAEPASADR